MGVFVKKEPSSEPVESLLRVEQRSIENTAMVMARAPQASSAVHFELEIVEGEIEFGVQVEVGDDGSGIYARHEYKKAEDSLALFMSPIGFVVEDGVPVPRFKTNSRALITYQTDAGGLSLRLFDDHSCTMMPALDSPSGEALECFDTSFLGAAELVSLRVGDFDGDDCIDMAYVVDHPIKGRQSYVFTQSSISDTAPEAYSQLWNAYEGLLASGIELDEGLVGRLRALGARLDEASAQGRPDIAERVRAYIKFAMDGAVKDPEQKLVFVELMLEVFERSGGDLDVLFQTAIDGGDDPLDNWPLLRLMAAMAGEMEGRVEDKDARFYLVNMVNGIFWNMRSGELPDYRKDVDFVPLVRSLVSMAERLTMEQLAAVRSALWFGTIRVGGLESFTPESLTALIDKALANDAGEGCYDTLFGLFKGDFEIEAEFLVKYGPFMHAHNLPTAEDIMAADEAIGHKDALLLYRKFNITRFKRYHPSILKHLVQMAKDPDHMRDRPLVMIVTAQYDYNGMFHWGKTFEHDPRVRIVAAEVSSYNEFKAAVRGLKEGYGVPDSVMITAHGYYHSMIMGTYDIDAQRDRSTGFLMEDRRGLGEDTNIMGTLAAYRDWIGDLGDVFGGARPQIVLNSCSTGKEPPEGELNVAQKFANVFQTEVHAPEAVEGLLKLDVEIDGKGRARLNPLFAEVRGGPIGINEGGRIFVPQPEGKITPRDYGGYGIHRSEDPNADSNPVNAELPDLIDGIRKLFR